MTPPPRAALIALWLVVIAAVGLCLLLYLLLPLPVAAAPCGLNDTGDTWGYSDPETGAWLLCPAVSPTPPTITPTPTPGPVLPVRWLPVVRKGTAPPPPVWQTWAPWVRGLGGRGWRGVSGAAIAAPNGS